MKSYSSYTYSTGYSQYENDYDRYGDIFRTQNPYKMNAPKIPKKLVSAIADSHVKATNAWKVHTAPPVDRSLFDRTIDTLMTANYMSAGFADGVVKNARGEGTWITPWTQMGQGFMAGVGTVFGDGNEKHEYTYSRVLETAGWKPESTFGKVLKGTIGFVGDVLLDPTTYMTFGVSSALKGTGRVGKAAIQLDTLVKKIPEQEIYNRTQSLISKGVSPERAAAGAKRLVEKNASKYQNVTELTSEMAENMIRFHAYETGVKLTPQELARDATNLAKQFNKAIGIRNYKRDMDIGVRNLPFVGDKLASKMGPLGKTVKLVDGNTIRKWSDTIGVAKKYSDARFAIYGSQFGKLLSTSAPRVRWAQKDPIQLYKIMAASEKLIGRDIDKITRKKEITDIAKSMNLLPDEQREIIRFLESSVNRHKVKTILRIGETQAAKVYKTMAQDMRPDEFKMYDELEGKYKAIKELEEEMKAYQAGDGLFSAPGIEVTQRALDELQGSYNTVTRSIADVEAEYMQKHSQYVAQLARVDMKKVKDVGEREFIVKALDEQIEHYVGSNKGIAKSLRSVRKDAEGTKQRPDKELVANALKLTEEYTKRDNEIALKIRELKKPKMKQDDSAVKEIQALRAEREEIARNVRILNKGDVEKYPFDYNPHAPTIQHINSIKRNIESLESLEKTVGLGVYKFDSPQQAKLFEITDSMSNYIFGRSGMLETITDPKIMQDLVNIMERGHSPSYIQSIPMIHNDKFLTPRASAMYKLIASELGYRNYSKEYLSKLKKLEAKAYMSLPKNMTAGTLTPVEKQRFDYLTSQRKQAILTKEMDAEYKSLVKKMQLQRDYEGMNPGNYNFRRLDAEEMQEYLRLKTLDDERNLRIEAYSRMSDAEFARHAKFAKERMQREDLEEMLHGVEGDWKHVADEKAVIQQDIFYDDVMREMRNMARGLPPKEQEEFFTKVMNKITEGTEYVNPTRVKEAPKSDLGDAVDAALIKQDSTYNLIQTAKGKLVSKFQGRAYADLTTAEQAVLIRSSLEGVLDLKQSDSMWKAIAMKGKETKDALAKTTRHEQIRETVWEGHVVNINKEKGVVMVRRDLETGTEYDVLMANGKTFTVSPDEITSISSSKRYVPEDVARSQLVQDSLGSKKELLARIKQIDKQLDELAGAKATTYMPGHYKRDINKLLKEQKALRPEMESRIAAFASERVPTQKAINAQGKMQKLETQRKFNRKELVKLRAQKKDAFAKIATIEEGALRKRDAITRAFNTHVMPDIVQKKTALHAMKDKLEKRIATFEADVADYTKTMNMYQDTIEALGGKAGVEEFEALAKKLDAYRMQFEDMDVLEDFMRMQIEKRGDDFDAWAKRTMDDESGLNAMLKTIDESPLSDKQKEWAKLVRENFFRAGVDEVRIGKLTEEQFEEMASRYVYHHATPEFLAHKAELEKAMGHSTPTQDYGYGNKWSGSSKARTQHEDIITFNAQMKDTLNGNKAFSEDLADIFLARMLKHEELMYDNKQMNTFAERFGTAYKYGDEVPEGYNVFGNYGKIREMIVEQTNQRFKQEIKLLRSERKGGLITEAERKALWERELQEVLPRYGFHDTAIMEGKTLPMLELTDEQRRLLSPTGLAYVMNTAIGDAANNARKIKMARDENELLQVYDKFQHFIKLNQTAVVPGFHVKNKYSNLFQSWLGVGRDAFNMKIHSAAMQTVFHKGDLNKLKTMKPLVSDDGTRVFHWHDIYEKALNWGVIDEGYFAQDLSKMTQSDGLFKNIISSKYDPTSTRDFVGYKFATNVGGQIENGDRLVHFASMLKQGHSIDDAAESVKKHLFDYSDLTPFERTVMKRIFPYYTWIRKNARLQTSALIDQPEKYAMVAKVHNGIEGMSNEEDRVDKTFLPEFAKDWIQTPFTTTNGQGQKIPVMLSPNMPYMDLARLPDVFNPVASAREWFNMSSPIMKVPLELATNYNSFFNENIVKSGEENPDDNTKSPALARLNHIAGQMGLYSAARNITSSQGSAQGFHVLNTLAGVKFMNHNEIFARQQFMKGLYEGNSDLGRAMTAFTEEIRTRITNKVYLMEGAMVSTIQNAAVALTGAPPVHPEDYKGALAPISKATYSELSAEERKKYAPPSKDDAAVYAREAKRLEEEAYRETGLIKKFVWSLFDETDRLADKEIVRVTEVADGDTFKVDNGSDSYSIRMLMVDTPETVDPDMDGPMPFGKEASDFSKTMLFGKDVSVQVHGRDAYNRTLAYIELDGNDYNRMLIEEGLGKMRFLDGTKDYERYTDYRRAEKQAADSKKGLWSREGYAEPGVDEGYNWGE